MLARREDVQWLRAVAIGAVVAFHCRRDLFPLGFLGVDVFFVISGFLMTAILERASVESPWRVALAFYDRRVRRILPTYLLAVTATLLLGLRLFFMPVDATVLAKDAVWSLGLAANLQPLAEHVDYFQLTTDFRPLAHAWSLGVELQFYLVAPVLLLSLLATPHPVLFTSVLTGASALLHWLSPAAWAFGFVPCRLWQFLAGTLAHLLTQAPDPGFQLLAPVEEHKKSLEPTASSRHRKMALFTCLIALLTICVWPVRPESETGEFVARTLATLLTGTLILGGRELEPLMPECVGGVLSGLGDASYSVYLVHWPVLVFCRYSGLEADSLTHIFVLLTLMAVLSMAQWRLVEKQVPKLSVTGVYGVIGVLFVGAVALLCTYVPAKSQGWQLPKGPIPVAESVRLNQDMAVNCGTLPFVCAKDALLTSAFHVRHPREDQLEGRCVVNVTEHGTRTMAVIGNCFAMRHFPMILEALNSSRHHSVFSRAYLANFRGCTSFDSVNDIVPERYECPEKRGQTLQFLRKLQPDLLIIVNRLDHVPTIQAPMQLEPDLVSTQISTDLLQLAATAKQVIVVQPHHVPANRGKGSAASISTNLRLGLPLDPAVMWNPVKVVNETLGDSWKRMSRALSVCRNCHVLESLSQFCNASTCGVVDPVTKLSYFCDGAHLSPAGTAVLLPSLRHLLNQLTFWPTTLNVQK